MLLCLISKLSDQRGPSGKTSAYLLELGLQGAHLRTRATAPSLRYCQDGWPAAWQQPPLHHTQALWEPDDTAGGVPVPEFTHHFGLPRSPVTFPFWNIHLLPNPFLMYVSLRYFKAPTGILAASRNVVRVLSARVLCSQSASAPQFSYSTCRKANQ